MYRTALHRLSHALTATASAALLAACAADRSLAPEAPALAANARAPELGACTNLEPRTPSKVSFHAYATGVQIYRWDGASWVFVAPDAELFADAGLHGKVATHYAGPTWESNSGSKVVGAVIDRCPGPDANAIPWLILGGASSTGPGVFDGTNYIQRVNTAGGKAPAAPGATVGEIARVPYTAEYYFYRAK